MGEATYTLEIRNIKKSDLPKIEAFIKQGRDAENYWQEHREMERSGNRAAFWSEFKKKFPDIVEYLEPTGLVDGDCNNDLAGQIDFDDCNGEMNFVLFDDGVFQYSAMVWHFSNWDHFLNYLTKKYGGTNGKWWSDEW